jgi:hypothetical protein
LPEARLRRMPFASIAFLQDRLPGARHHRMMLAFIVASRCCRRRGTSACRLHALLLAGASAFQASTRAAAGGTSAYTTCMHCCWQELPRSRHRRIPFASIAAGRCCRRRGLSACRLHALLLAGAAAGEVLAHAACSHCCWQELPPASNERMPLASIVAGRRRHR